jgi:hypothetical protein
MNMSLALAFENRSSSGGGRRAAERQSQIAAPHAQEMVSYVVSLHGDLPSAVSSLSPPSVEYSYCVAVFGDGSTCCAMSEISGLDVGCSWSWAMIGSMGH